MRRAAVLATPVFLALAAAAVLAQPAGYELSWSRVAAGGPAISAGGAYTLGGAAGEDDAASLSGGPYSLSGGFWGGVSGLSVPQRVYVPLAIKAAAP